MPGGANQLLSRSSPCPTRGTEDLARSVPGGRVGITRGSIEPGVQRAASLTEACQGIASRSARAARAYNTMPIMAPANTAAQASS